MSSLPPAPPLSAIRGEQICPPSIAKPKVLRTQAQRIFDRFSMTPYELAQILGYDPTSCYKWTYPKDKGGSDGRVPGPAMRELSRLARLYGVLLHPEDYCPDPLE